MTVGTLLTRLDGRATRYLTAPEPNAAGRMGLFRILYALFYLWYLVMYPAEANGGYALFGKNRIVLVEFLPTLTPVALQLVEAGLVAALVLLALGYRTRVATTAVLVLGVVLGAVSASLDVERSAVLLIAFIPLLMIVAGNWGDTHSLDALRMRSKGKTVVSPRDPSGRNFLGAHAVFVVLALLFASAGLSKVVLPTSTWLTHPDLIANLALELNVKAVVDELPDNPAAAWIARTEVVHEGLRFAIVAFELSFLLALFSRTLRQLVIASGLVFSSLNALVLGVTFTPILIAFAPFVDWQALLDRLFPRRKPLSVPRHAIMPGLLALAAAGVAASVWHTTSALQRLVTVGDVLDWRTIWYLILPLALGWLLAQFVAIGKRLRRVSPDQLGMRAPR